MPFSRAEGLPFRLGTGQSRERLTMRWFVLQRRLFAALSITVLAGGMALLSGSAASAAPTNAINFGLSMVARLEIGIPPVPPNARPEPLRLR